jgi:hypothetical protein
MASHDYSGSGDYFITIFVKEMACLLGGIRKGRMNHSRFGEIAHAAWLEIPVHFPAAEPDEFVVMPNHLHGIFRLRPEKQQSGFKDDFSHPISGSLASVIRSYSNAKMDIIVQSTAHPPPPINLHDARPI